jgi:site-specific recombinase XerD
MRLPTYAVLHNYRNRTNQNGLYPIHIRITINRKSEYHEVEVPQKVHPNEFQDKEKAWVKNTHPYAFEINNTIDEKITLLTDLNKRYYTAKKALTFPLVFKELEKNFNRQIFNKYFEEIIKNPPENLDSDTMGRYGSALAALNKFNPTIAFHELNEQLFKTVKKYLMTDLKLVGSTTVGYFNAYKKVVYWSRLDGHITKAHEETLFEKLHIKKGRPKKDHLEVEEIQQWKNADCSGKYASFERDRDMFMLLIYTGYYYSDLRTLLKTELRKDPQGYYLRSDRYKNDELALVPLWTFPDAMTLINKYRNHDPEDPYLIDRQYILTDQVFNRRIKIIANEILEWTRPIKNKLARFTNTQLYIRYGTMKPVVSKIRGHQRAETTDVYYQVNIREVVEGTKNLNFKELLET